MASALHKKFAGTCHGDRFQRALPALLTRMDDGVFLVGEGGALIDFNPQACAMLGYSGKELANLKWSDLLAYSCDPGGCQALQGGLEMKPPVHECVLRRCDGQTLPVEINAGRLDDESEELLFYLVRDISARKDAENRLRRSEQRFRSFFKNAAAGMAILNPHGDFLEANDAFCAFIGYEPHELKQMNVEQITSGDNLEETRRYYRQVRQGRTICFNYEKEYRRKDGTHVYGRVSVAWVHDDSDHAQYGIGLVQDITDHRAAQRDIERLVNFDQLTGLPNRRHFQETLAQDLGRFEESGDTLGILFLDLDHFKRVNDTMGHGVGDQLLRLAGSRLVELTGPSDLVARLGGDEFAVVLREINEVEDVAALAEKVRQGFETPFNCDGEECLISVSVGVAVVPNDGQEVEALLKNAEIAMYDAKESGRNLHRFYSSDIHARAAYRQLLDGHLAHALEKNEFTLHYQPQFNLSTGKLVGMEALLRWNNPLLGPIAPDRFIYLAEESGLILKIGDWVLRTACRRARLWQELGFTGLRMAVNVSGRQFREVDFAQRVARILEECGLEPSSLEIELTESCIMDNPDRVRRILLQLKEMGVHLAVDDFGTGYSSLSYLKGFPFSRVKIDRTFVHDVDTDPDDAVITQTIIAMAHTLGMEVLAEGAETEAHIRLLREYGCDEVQGYHYGRPLPEDEFTELLRRQPDYCASSA
jgi:diguanylate cyclase (GGDEF)-like protein/PAS domain S-box-containing protein